MAVLCGMPTIQNSAQSGPIFVHTVFTSCIQRCPVSRSRDWVLSMLSVVLLILLIYSFQFRPAFLPRRSTKLQSSVRTWFEQYRTSEVAEKKNFFLGGRVPGRSVQAKEWLWIDSIGRNEN